MFQSKRLYFREIRQDDYETLQVMFSDPNVMRFANGPKTKSETKEWMNQAIGDYKRFGVGFWIAEKRDTGEFIGQCGFRPQKINGHVRMSFGYSLANAFWGNGYGKEAALACRHFAFEHLGIYALTSIIHPENAPSIKIARAIGMTKHDKVFQHNQWQDMYRLENASYQNRHGMDMKRS